MKIFKHLTLLTLCSSLLLAAPSKKKEAEYNSVVNMGQHSSQLLIQTLGKNMKKRIKDGGTLEALDFCANEAYTLTESVNKKLPNGVRVKRISSKYRSPANKPSTDELAVLASFEQMKKADILLPKYLIQKVDLHVFKYYKPLVIKKKTCLKCHGTNKDIKDIEVKQEIAKRYPLDNARGYKMNDLRGAVVVEIDKRVR